MTHRLSFSLISTILAAVIGLGLLPTLATAQLPGREVEGCYYFARVAQLRVENDSLKQNYYFTPMLFSAKCASPESIKREIRKVLFTKTHDPNVRDNHIVLKGPYRDEDDAEEAYWQFITVLPPESTRHLLPIKLP